MKDNPIGKIVHDFGLNTKHGNIPQPNQQIQHKCFSKSQLILFGEIDKLILKSIRNCKGPSIAKSILKKKNKVGGFKLLNFKIYYKTMVE